MSVQPTDPYAYVIRHYDVPVTVGQRVVHAGRDHGTVVTPEHPDAHVHVLFDGEEHPASCHPLSLDYGDGIGPDQRTAHRNARVDTWNDRLNNRITDEEYRERMNRPLVPEEEVADAA